MEVLGSYPFQSGRQNSLQNFGVLCNPKSHVDSKSLAGLHKNSDDLDICNVFSFIEVSAFVSNNGNPT